MRMARKLRNKGFEGDLSRGVLTRTLPRGPWTWCSSYVAD